MLVVVTKVNLPNVLGPGEADFRSKRSERWGDASAIGRGRGPQARGSSVHFHHIVSCVFLFLALRI